MTGDPRGCSGRRNWQGILSSSTRPKCSGSFAVLPDDPGTARHGGRHDRRPVGLHGWRQLRSENLTNSDPFFPITSQRQTFLRNVILIVTLSFYSQTGTSSISLARSAAHALVTVTWPFGVPFGVPHLTFGLPVGVPLTGARTGRQVVKSWLVRWWETSSRSSSRFWGRLSHPL